MEKYLQCSQRSKKLLFVMFTGFMLMFSQKLLAQTPPAFSYGTPQTYTTSIPVAALNPVFTSSNTAALPGYSTQLNIVITTPHIIAGIAADAAGNIYFGNESGSQIYKIPAGGSSAVPIGSIHINTPSCVAVDAAGNVYTVDSSTGTISKILASDGSTVTLATELPYIYGIAVDAAGNVYLSDYHSNSIREILASNGSLVTIGSGFNNPKSLAVDAVGNVYFSDYGNNAIKEIPAGGGSVITLLSGIAADPIALDPTGNLYIVNGTVQELPAPLTPGGALKTIINNQPRYIAFDGHGNMLLEANGQISEVKPAGGYYISPALPSGLNFDITTGTISGTPTAASPATDYTVIGYNAGGGGTATVNIKVNAIQPPAFRYSTPQTYTTSIAITALNPVFTGSYTAALPGYSSSPVAFDGSYNFDRAVGVATDKSGNVYMVQTNSFQGNPTAYKIPAAGGSPVVIGAGYSTPYGIATDRADNVYITDGNTIKKILAADGSTVTIGTGFSRANGLTVDAAGNVYVADIVGGLVKEILAADGSVTTIGSGFDHPESVAVDAAGNVYVADNANSAIKEVPANGGSIITLASGFHSVGITLDALGNLYIINRSVNKVVRLSAPLTAGGTLTTVFDFGSLAVANAVAVDGSGNLFVACSGAMYEFKPVGGYYISPALPTGLNFDSITGIISGTPTAASLATDYTVTGYNGGGSGTATVNIKVNAIQPPAISYSTPQTYFAGNAITALSPTLTGGNAVVAPGYSSTITTFATNSDFLLLTGVATDKAGNVYVAQPTGNSEIIPGIRKISASGSIVTYISSGAVRPQAIATDAAGNIYVAGPDGTINKILATDRSVITIGTGFGSPGGLAADGAGNVYIADTNNSLVKKILASDGSIVTIGSGFNKPTAVAVDATGNVYVADNGNTAIKEIPAGGGSIIILESGFACSGLSLDQTGDLYMINTTAGQIQELGVPLIAGGAIKTIATAAPYGIAIDGTGNMFLADGTKVDEIKPFGGYYITPALPAGLTFNNTTGIISGTPTSASAATDYTITAQNGGGAGMATVNIQVQQPAPPVISYNSPQIYPTNIAITALNPVLNGGNAVAAPGYSSGANPFLDTHFGGLAGVATDKAGNVYVAEHAPFATSPGVYQFTAAGTSLAHIASGITPLAIAIDGAGNVYVSDANTNGINKIAASNGSVTAIGTGFNSATGLAVDAAGNVYVADTGNNLVKEILASNGNTVTIGSGFNGPKSVAVDAAGNVYVADNGNSALKEIPAGGASVITLASGFACSGLALDVAGNLFFINATASQIQKLQAPLSTSSSLKTIANFAGNAITLDGQGNIIVVDNQQAYKITPVGGYYITPALPAGLSFDNTTGTISGTPNGASAATDYTIAAYNAGGGGTTTVNITVNQTQPPVFGYNSPQTYITFTPITTLSPVITGGSAVPAPAYSGSANTLTIGFSGQAGIAADKNGNYYVSQQGAFIYGPGIYKLTAPGGGNRTAVSSTVTTPGCLAVDAAGNIYVLDAADGAIKKISASDGSTVTIGTGFSGVLGLAVDLAGNVYVADTNNSAVKKISAVNNSVSTIGSGFNHPTGVAVDGAGNVYVADNGNGAIKEIPAGGGSVITLVSGFASAGLALDGAGNLFIINSTAGTIQELPSPITAGGALTTITSFAAAAGIAIDGTGNMFLLTTGASYQCKPIGGYHLSQSLPAGLGFDSATGTINGTPTSASLATDYTVTAYNAGGSGTGTVNIMVNPLQSPAISYSTPQTYTEGTAIATLSPLSNGGAVASPGYATKSSILISGFDNISGVTADGAGNVYVANEMSGSKNAGIYKIAPGGGSAQAIGANINSPTCVAVDVAGNVYAADASSGTIKKILASDGSTAVIAAGVGIISSIAIDAAGNLYFSDIVNNSIKKILASNGSVVTLGSGFSLPSSVVVDAAGNVYFSDNGNKAIKEIPADGGSIVAFNPGAQVYSLALDAAAGNLYIVNGLARAVQQLHLPLSPSPTLKTILNVVPVYIALDGGGNLFFDGSGQINKIKPVGGCYITPALPAGLNFDSTTGTISGTPTAKSPATNYTVTAYNAAGSSTATVTITVNPPPPVIPATTISTALSSTFGTASGSTSFNVSGTNLTAGILVTPPPGFEVSTDNSTFNPTLTVGAAPAVASTQVFIRLATTDAAGDYSGDVVLSTAGAPDVKVATVASRVNTASLTITAKNVTKTYGTSIAGTSGSTNYAITGGSLQNGNTISSVTIAYGTGAAATDAAGTYSGAVTASAAIGANGFLNSNYNITYTSGNITASTKALVIKAINKGKTYGANLPTFTVTYSGFVNGETSASLTTLPTISTSASAASPAGTYPITAIGAADANYTISYTAGTLTVNPKALTITAVNHGKTYGSALPALTVSYSGFTNGDNSTSLTNQPTISTTGTAASPVGTYPITAMGAADANYTISYVAGTLTVSAKALTITAINQTKAYGAALPTLTASYNGFVNGDDASKLTTKPTLSTTGLATSPKGTYPITAIGAVDANYTINYVPGTLTVNPVTLTITADNQSKAYGAALPTLTASYNGFVNGDDASKLTTPPTIATAATAASAVGSYAVTASGAASTNYTITYVAGNLNVTKVGLTIAADNQTKAYGAALPTLTASYNGFVNGDDASKLTTPPTIATAATAASAVGWYPVTVSGAASPNYAITYVVGNLNVTKVGLTITADNQTKAYGAALPSMTASYSGFVNGDDVSKLTAKPIVSTTGLTTSPKGTYPITVTGAVDANYTMSYVPGTLTVNPVTLTITADNQTKAYGAALPTLTASYNGFVNGDDASKLTTKPSLSTTGLATSPKGTYPITAMGAVDANYNISYVPGTLTVNPVTLTITANNQTKAYGAALPALSASYYGFVNGDTKASLTTQPNIYTTGTASSPKGTYPITTTGAVDANYIINYVQGTLTVNPKALIITAVNHGKTYGSALPALTVSYNGFIAGESAGNLTVEPTISTTATAASPIGTYPIVATGAAGVNYAISYVPGNLTIGKKALTITAVNKSKTYGAASPTFTVTYNGFVNGDNASALTIPPTITTTATVASPVGTYPITATGAVDANYTISYVSGTLTVTPKSLIITAANKSKIYGGAVPPLTLVYSGFITGEGTANFTTQPTISTTGTAASATGNYPITATGAADTNYTISYVAGALTVGKAALTIVANDVNKTVGATLTGGPGSLAFTSSGLVGTETIGSVTIAYSTGAASGAALSTYTGSIIPSAATGGTFTVTNYRIIYVAGNIMVTKPVIIAAGSLIALGTMQGSPSISAGFSVSGANVIAGVLVTPPAGFEVSKDNITFGSSVTIGYVSGASPGIVATALVYIRLTSLAAVGTYSGNIALSSANAVSVNIPVPVSTVHPLLPTPVTQARLVTFANTTPTSTTVSWTNGTGAGRVVFIRLGATGSAMPGNGTLYTASTTYGKGATIGLSGWYCIYNGAGSAVDVSGLTQGTTYRVTVLEYNGTPGDAAYLERNLLPGDPNYVASRVSPANVTTPAIYPTIPARLVTFSNTTATSTTANWTNGDGTARAVFMEMTGTGSVVLADNAGYNANSKFGLGSTVVMSGKPFYCIYNGTGSSVNISGLSPGTLYRVSVVEYKNGPGNQRYLNAGQSPANITTGIAPLYSILVPKEMGEQTPLVSSFGGERVEANNILSPNGDGINDIWVVRNIAFYPGNTVTVYNRQGIIVFTKKGYANDWNGSYHGAVLDEGTYYYKVDLGNGASISGYITMVRDK